MVYNCKEFKTHYKMKNITTTNNLNNLLNKIDNLNISIDQKKNIRWMVLSRFYLNTPVFLNY